WILFFHLTGLASLVDLATTISFLTAPVLAILNHRAMMGPEVGEEHRISRRLRVWSLASIATMVGLAIGYLALVF
ncbi:MAG: divalent metal cation transporter, partial [Pseudomonadota bacterium]